MLLPQYFGTNNIRSFYKQIYNYKFKAHKFNNHSSMYTSQIFTRGQYSTMMISNKSTQKLDSNSSIEMIRAEYDRLEAKYNIDIQKAIDLQKQTEELIRENKKIINDEVSMRLNLIDMNRVGMLAFLIQVCYPEKEIETMICNYILQNQFIQPPLSFEDIRLIVINKRLDEYIKTHIKHVFENPTYCANFNIAACKICLRFLNNRFFHLDFDTFYQSVIMYLMNNEESEKLRDHKNFYIVKELKDTVDDLVDISYRSLVKSQLLNILTDFYKGDPCQFICTKFEITKSREDDCFSVRSFKDQLLLNNIDITGLFSYNIEDF